MGVHMGVCKGVHKDVHMGVNKGVQKDVHKDVHMGVRKGVCKSVHKGVHKGCTRVYTWRNELEKKHTTRYTAEGSPHWGADFTEGVT